MHCSLADTHIWLDQSIITLILALASFIGLILVACSQFISLPPSRRRSTRYGNVTITPLRRGPFHMLRKCNGTYLCSS